MKYDSKNQPLVCMQTQSTCYNGTYKLGEIKGILWHSTGANNPNLKRYVQPSDNASNRARMYQLLGTNTYKNDWNHIVHYAGMNAWIGKLADGTVTTVQTMPWDYRPWGCGSGSKGSCNSGWIQFEICEDGLNDKSYFEKVYKEACELTAYLCKMFNLDPHGTVSYKGVNVPVILCHQDSYRLGLGGNHADIYHWFPKYGKNMETVRDDVAALLKENGTQIQPQEPVSSGIDLYRVRLSWDNPNSQLGAYRNLNNAIAAVTGNYKVFNSKGEQVYPENKVVNNSVSNKLQIKDLAGLSRADILKKVGPLFTEDQKKTGVLASVSMAQFLLESGWGTSPLAVEANNGFGMKTSLSGNTWPGSTWKGEVYDKETKEWDPIIEDYKTITAPFRKYSNLADSIEDHSAYLLGAKKGTALRYAGLKGETDCKKAFQIIKDGGYATSPTYVQNLCNVVTSNNLTAYDYKDTVVSTPKEEPRVETSSFKSYTVRMKTGAKSVNIRAGAGVLHKKTGVIADRKEYTIIEEKNGWGRLKSKVGWISLKYFDKVREV